MHFSSIINAPLRDTLSIALHQCHVVLQIKVLEAKQFICLNPALFDNNYKFTFTLPVLQLCINGLEALSGAWRGTLSTSSGGAASCLHNPPNKDPCVLGKVQLLFGSHAGSVSRCVILIMRCSHTHDRHTISLSRDLTLTHVLSRIVAHWLARDRD